MLQIRNYRDRVFPLNAIRCLSLNELNLIKRRYEYVDEKTVEGREGIGGRIHEGSSNGWMDERLKSMNDISNEGYTNKWSFARLKKYDRCLYDDDDGDGGDGSDGGGGGRRWRIRLCTCSQLGEK